MAKKTCHSVAHSHKKAVVAHQAVAKAKGRKVENLGDSQTLALLRVVRWPQ